MSNPRGAGAERIEFGTRDELERWLKGNGHTLWAQQLLARRSTMRLPDRIGDYEELHLAAASQLSIVGLGESGDGVHGEPANIFVTVSLLAELEEEMQKEGSEVSRLSTRPIIRAFVYLDISDFSKIAAGVQLLVIQSLIRISAQAEKNVQGTAEAKLCIGDGYIYVWDEAVAATWFAGSLAREIEDAVARERAPEFHFRIGVHVGPVRCFWDAGRKDWNYVGDGINGGNRVLSAIGKETDDVVFVSGQVRTAISKNDNVNRLIVPHLLNRGRKADKHGKHWRVYEYNHSFPV